MMQRTLGATFHLTHHCNLRCSYCYTGEKLAISMSRETVDAAIDFILAEAEKRQCERLDITFFGGEPLLEKIHIFYIAETLAERAAHLRITYKLSTNGTLITEQLMQQLMEHRIFTSLSLDGPPNVHDSHRPQAGGQPSSRNALKAAKIMLEYNPCTSVSCVVSPNTAAYLADSVDYLYQLGFRYLVTTLDYSADW